MMDDPLLLARLQFAANISFHILFPTISISLGWLLLFFRLRHASQAPATSVPAPTKTVSEREYAKRK